MANETPKIAKVTVDRNLCIGAASCVVIAGAVFELDSENKAVLKLKGGTKNSGPTERSALEDTTTDNETLILAAQSCPTKAIFLYDETGKQVYP